MRLQKIVLNGFKSFADKTEFVFDAQITGIVGPNGCGKSNVVDAVKWVLGEQSAKSLRSGQMADVIFGGCSSRKALSTAEVSLIFSNTSGKLSIESDEVQISRRIFRSGESEYRVNGKPCRLKDLREMFMDTGVGVRAYSIIEQGHVERLLMASKMERRAIFEEAAGISKYRAQKIEATRKLERTDQNLLRVADVLAEIQKQLRSVKLQAGKARNYLQYKDRLKELLVGYSVVEYRRNKDEIETRQNQLGQFEQQFAGVANEIAKNDASASELGQKIHEIEIQINETDNLLVTVKSRIDQQMQRIDFLRIRIKELEQRKQSAAEQIEQQKLHQRQFNENSAQFNQQLEQSEELLQNKTAAFEELRQTMHEVNAAVNSVYADLEDEKSGIIDIVRRTAQLHNEVQSISAYRDNLANQKDRLANRADSAKVELEGILTEKAQHNARLSDINKVLEELQQSLDFKRVETEKVDSDINDKKQLFAKAKENLSGIKSELSVLDDMEQRREGLAKAVKNILQAKNNGGFEFIEGIIADKVTADPEYALAIEAALEGISDAVIVNDSATLLANKEAVEKFDGRINFVCMDRITPFSNIIDPKQVSGVIGRAVEFVSYEGKFGPLIWNLLGKTLVVSSTKSSPVLPGYNYVTMSGEFLSSDGSIRIGPLGKKTGLITRKSRLQKLRKDMEEVTLAITTFDDDIRSCEQSREHLNKLCKELRTSVYEANTEKVQVFSKITILEKDFKRLADEQPIIARELGSLEQQIEASVQREYDSKQKLEELETVNLQRKNRIIDLEQQYASAKENQQNCQEQHTELRVSVGSLTEQTKGLRQTIASLQSQVRQSLAVSESAKNEIESCATQAQDSAHEILELESGVSDLFVGKDKTGQLSRQLHENLNEMLNQQKTAEIALREKRSQQTEIDRNINQLRIELGQFEVKQQSLIERVQEEMQIDITEIFDKYEGEQTDWDAAKTEIAELRNKIDRLGNVNVDSIQEQEDLEKRNEFLTTQVEDLNSSKAQLQQLISKLNKISREKFQETFEDIRVNFQQLFRKLFGGGKADIVLEEAEDILDAGIEIVARPPGKETRSISLLSGGEKTMTAIALLFAVFKSKPSPFCLLDEVDAALDEANNERLNLVVKEFQNQSQFIIITHSKRTMSMADLLYGVTMQTQGISKKISVRFGDVVNDDEAAA